MNIIEDRRDKILVVTINRPERRNALDADTIAELGETFVAAEGDPGIAVIVLSGAGDRAFCAGMDLKAFAEGKTRVHTDRPGTDIFTRRIYSKPIIAAANGSAIGGGFELMMACDIVVAAEHAQFGIAEVKRGLIAAGGEHASRDAFPFRLPLRWV